MSNTPSDRQQPRQRRRRRARWAGVFFEMAICCGVLALIMAAIAQTGVVFLHQQQAMSLREVAAQEASNLLEQTRSVPFAELTPERLDEAISLRNHNAKNLVDAKWDVDSESENGLQSKRIVVTLNWSVRGQQRKTRLTTWRFAPEEPANADDENDTDENDADDDADAAEDAS